MQERVKFFFFFFAGLILGLSFILVLEYSNSSIFSSNSVQLVSSPENGQELISFIHSAKESVYVEVYILTSEEVISELIEAHNEGLEVKVILEKRYTGSNSQEAFNELTSAGIDVRWASYDYKLTHAKMIIIDEKKASIGSHNFSDSAIYSNREISVILEGDIITQLLKIFETDWIKATY